MQFLEWSVIGLRAARHEFRHPDRDVTVTLLPMVHLGERAFFDGVYADAAAHDVVVLEGVTSPTTQRVTRAYRWAKPSRLGLIVQPKFPREDVETVLGDLPGAEFDALWTQGPRLERFLFEAGASGFGLWLRLTATRASLGKVLNTTDKKDREAILAWSARMAPMLNAMEAAREAVLCRTVHDLVGRPVPPKSIAVIYGAGHMGVLTHDLTKAGFRPVDAEWMTVFGS